MGYQFTNLEYNMHNLIVVNVYMELLYSDMYLHVKNVCGCCR